MLKRGPRRVLALVSIVAFGVVGCAHVVDGQPRARQGSIGAPIVWGPCEIAILTPEDMPQGAECGELAVPIDYGQPEKGVATIALFRVRATGSKIGSLIVNPGGPGVSGVFLAADMARGVPTQVRERFDLVGFDPRGVGFSRPALRCLSDADIDRYRATDFVDYNPNGTPGVDYSPEGVARNEEALKHVVDACVSKIGKDVLASVGTVNVVKDLDSLRAALGDEKLTYLGYSYGTMIGGLYAEAYPGNVRAIILDGVMDPTAAPLDAAVDQAAAFQLAFNDYAADCAKSPDCPLGTDPGKAVQVYRSLVEPLVAHPAATTDPRGLSYKDAVVGTWSAFYSRADWELLTKGLTQLRNGEKPDALLANGDFYYDRSRDGRYSNYSDAYTAITCADQAYPTDTQSWVDADKRLRDLSPFQSFGSFTGHAPKGICAFWPVAATNKPHRLSAPGLPPILVISTTHDPATPYQDGVDVADQLGATVLTVEGTQHTAAFSGDKCVDDIATRYLVDLILPAPGARCDLSDE
jgi:pimeloyl-ACP methyl ester carboxylesterase